MVPVIRHLILPCSLSRYVEVAVNLSAFCVTVTRIRFSSGPSCQTPAIEGKPALALRTANSFSVAAAKSSCFVLLPSRILFFAQAFSRSPRELFDRSLSGGVDCGHLGAA